MIGARTPPRPPVASDPGSFARYLRAAERRGRRRSGGGLRYEIVVAVLWFAPATAVGAWQDLDRSTSGTPSVNWVSAGLLVLAGAALVGLAAAAIGPVSASREWRAWVLSTPLDRGYLLRRRAAGRLSLLLVPGIVIGAVIADAAGFRHQQALACVTTSAACAVVAGGVAMWQQRETSAGTPRGRGWLWCTAGLVLAAVPANLLAVHALRQDALWAVAIVASLLAVTCGWGGLRGVGLIPLSTLAAGSGSTSSIALALADQSLAPLSGILAAGPGRRPSSAPRRALTGVGQGALVAMDRRRTLRNRSALVRWVAMAALPSAAWALLHGVGWAPSALAVVAFVAGVAAVSGFCSTVRQFAGNPPLADRYGLDRGQSKGSAMQLPRIAALVWGIAVAPVLVLHTPQVMAFVIPVMVLAVVEFRARLGPFQPNFVMGEQYSQDLGRLFARGPALLLGGCVIAGLLVAGLQQRHL